MDCDRPAVARGMCWRHYGGRDGEDGLCGAPECDKPSRRGGLCWTHLKRQQRGKNPFAPVMPGRGPGKRKEPTETLTAAAIAFADASSEDDGDYHRKHARLYMAALRIRRRKASNECPQSPDSGERG